jgi:hypothetical protein
MYHPSIHPSIDGGPFVGAGPAMVEPNMAVNNVPCIDI